MKNDAAGSRPRTKSRKKITSAARAAANEPAPLDSPAAETPLAETASPAPEGASAPNVGSIEAVFSLAAGALFIVAAVFPRSIKQVFLLMVGAGLIHRGRTRHCLVYEALKVPAMKD